MDVSGDGICSLVDGEPSITECVSCSYFVDDDVPKPWLDCGPEGEVMLNTSLLLSNGGTIELYAFRH